MSEPKHILCTYNDVHNIIKRSAEKIAEWKPNLLIAIGLCISAIVVLQLCIDTALDRRRVSSTHFHICLCLLNHIVIRGFFPARVLVRCHGVSSVFVKTDF